MERPEQKSDSLRVLPVLADATSSSKNKTAIRGAKRRNNKGQLVREKVALPAFCSLSFSISSPCSQRTSKTFHLVHAKWEKSTEFPAESAKRSYALFMRAAKCTRASQIRIYYCYSSIRKKHVGISRIVRTHNGGGWWQRNVFTSEYFKIRVSYRNEGAQWERHKGRTKFSAANWKLNFVSSPRFFNSEITDSCLF